MQRCYAYPAVGDPVVKIDPVGIAEVYPLVDARWKHNAVGPGSEWFIRGVKDRVT